MEIKHLSGRQSSKVNRWIKKKRNWTSGERSLQISLSSHFIQMKAGRFGSWEERRREGGCGGVVVELPSQWATLS